MHKIILVCFLGISLIACGTAGKKPVKAVDKLAFAGELLTFSEEINGRPESNVRMIIVDGYLRIDDGPQSEDYLLFDRTSKIIYNIVAEDKTILVMDAQDNDEQKKLKAPFPILWNVISQTSHVLMRTNDENATSATYYQLKLNQKDCYNLVAIDQGMEKPLAALREYRQALANQLKTQYIPQKGRACYEAVNIFTPLNHLVQGFPVREWSAYGYQRFLADYRKMIIFPERLFELPEGYKRVDI